MKLINDRATLYLFSPVRGRHYLIARFNTVIREFFLSAHEPAPIFGFIILIPIFERIAMFPFIWKQLMTEQDAIAKGLQPLVTFQKNVTEKGESPDKVATQKMCVVIRTNEEQYYLLDREIHPFILDITTVDGGALQFIFVFTIRILDAQKVLADYPKGNFLESAEKQLISELSCIFRPKKFTDLRRVQNDEIKEKNEGITKALNKKFRPHGFELLQVMLEEVIILPNSQDRIDSEEAIGIAENKNKATVLTAHATAKSTKITKTVDIEMKKKEKIDVGLAENTVLEGRLDKIFKFHKKDRAIVDQTQTTVSKNLGEAKGTLVFGHGVGIGNTDRLVNALVANTIQTKQEGGNDE